MADSQSVPAEMLPKESEQYDWIAMKSLISAHEQAMSVMEQHALSTLSTGDGMSNDELITQLESARGCHEQAIADLDTAIAALHKQAIEESTSKPTSRNTSD
jgi:hypothetical protein